MSPQTHGVVEWFFGTLKYEQLYCAIIRDGDGLAVETGLFRHTSDPRRGKLAPDVSLEALVIASLRRVRAIFDSHQRRCHR